MFRCSNITVAVKVLYAYKTQTNRLIVINNRYRKRMSYHPAPQDRLPTEAKQG